MRYFFKNGDLTFMSRLGEVKNFANCSKACNKKKLVAFQLHDFYNFADELNQTNFLYQNQTNTNDVAQEFTFRETVNRLNEDFELCTDVRFDFERRKWTDGPYRALELVHNLWDNKANIWPLQPYQPEFVMVNYQLSKTNQGPTIAPQSISIASADGKNSCYYKCHNRTEIRQGFFNDAFKDCEKSNSTFQTYLNQVNLSFISLYYICYIRFLITFRTMSRSS